MGGSLGPVLGSAVIGDIFKQEERGGAMGICFAASKLLFLIFGCLDLISIEQIGLFRSILTPLPAGTFFFKLQRQVLQRHLIIMLVQVGLLIPIREEWCMLSIEKMKAAKGIDSSTPFVFKFINPFKSLWLLRSPSLLLTVRFYAITLYKNH